MKTYHIAQANIAQAKDGMDSKTMKGFVERLDEINFLADKSDGFVWRLQADDGNATSIQVFDDPLIIFNMSVWQDIETLKQFVYKSIHTELIKSRHSWFNKMEQYNQALWWIPVGDIPSTQNGRERLEHLQKHGPTAKAFSFAKTFQPTE